MNIPAARVVFPPATRRQILAAIDEALETGCLTLGPRTAELEEAFAARHGARHAVAVSSGTAALEIILRGLGPEAARGEWVVPANTFFATAAAVLHAGGRVRLADVDARTLCLSAETVEAALTDDTVGVLLVHIGGAITPDAPAIRDVCQRRGLLLVEDAAHAHGASLDGQHAGAFGVAAAFSFYPTKVMTAGEGGMILTADEGLRDEARTFRDQGKASFLGGDHVRLGAAWRMSELHAAVALGHMALLDDFMACRNQIAARYDEGLAGLPGITSLHADPAGGGNVYKYLALLDAGVDRAGLKARLREVGVSLSGEVYASPLHHQPVFAGLDRSPSGLAVSEDVCARHVCLPVHSDMTEKEADHVMDCLEEVLT